MAEPPSTDRRGRRRAETRRQLMESGHELFARQGIENTAISEITENADLGFGSFYNHFESKEELAIAVLTEDLAAHAEEVRKLTEHLKDPAEVVATAHRYYVQLARRRPEWAWLLVRLDVARILGQTLGAPAAQDLRRGIEQGRFQVANEQTAIQASGGALLAVLRGVLTGSLPKNADRQHAEGVLRMFGVPAEEAAEIAQRPLPRRR